MPALSYPTADFQPNTVIYSSEVNGKFNAIATLLNTTKLDSTNVQTGGLTGANIAAAAAGSGLSKDGSGNFAVNVDDSTVEVSSDALRVKDSGITVAKLAAAVVAYFNPIGSILAYGGTSAPSGYLLCNGARVSRTTYADLFNAIGTKWGTGDGSTTFNLPDFRGTFLRGYMGIADVTCTGSASSDNVTATAHGYNRSGIKVQVTGTPVTGLSLLTDYWTIYIDDNTLAFGSTRANAIAGTKIALSGSAGSMTIVQHEDENRTSRVALAPGGNTDNNLGSYQTDAMQGHIHETQVYGFNPAGGGGSFTAVTLNSGAGMGATPDSGAPLADGTNGTPRTSAETRPQNSTVNYIIKT